MFSREITYSKARAEFASILEEVEQNHSIVVVNRRGHEGVALIAAEELSSMIECLHLMRSPRNARWLLESMTEADEGEVMSVADVDELARKLDLDQAADCSDTKVSSGLNLLDQAADQESTQDSLPVRSSHF